MILIFAVLRVILRTTVRPAARFLSAAVLQNLPEREQSLGQPLPQLISVPYHPHQIIVFNFIRLGGRQNYAVSLKSRAHVNMGPDAYSLMVNMNCESFPIVIPNSRPRCATPSMFRDFVRLVHDAPSSIKNPMLSNCWRS